MFEQIKIEVYAVIAIIIIAAIGFFAWKYQHTETQLATAKTANTELTTANKTDTATIAAVQKSDAITESTEVKATQQAQATNDNTAAITNSVNSQIAKIKQQYAGKPKVKKPTAPATATTTSTPSSPPAITEGKAIAQVLITGLWDKYCNGVPGAQGCPAPTPAST